MEKIQIYILLRVTFLWGTYFDFFGLFAFFKCMYLLADSLHTLPGSGYSDFISTRIVKTESLLVSVNVVEKVGKELAIFLVMWAIWLYTKCPRMYLEWLIKFYRKHFLWSNSLLLEHNPCSASLERIMFLFHNSGNNHINLHRCFSTTVV